MLFEPVLGTWNYTNNTLSNKPFSAAQYTLVAAQYPLVTALCSLVHSTIITLQPVCYEQELSRPLLVPGVAIGLAWTAVGGETVYIEACKMPGEGKLVLTGQLGELPPTDRRLLRGVWLLLLLSFMHLSLPTPKRRCHKSA